MHRKYRCKNKLIITPNPVKVNADFLYFTRCPPLNSSVGSDLDQKIILGKSPTAANAMVKRI